MARIILNDEIEIKGLLTAGRKEDEDGNMIIAGELVTHGFYEDITSIETDRYIFEDVDVTAEEFASNDFMIRYEFFAESISIKGGVSNLSEEIRKQIEDEYFKFENTELLHKATEVKE